MDKDNAAPKVKTVLEVRDVKKGQAGPSLPAIPFTVVVALLFAVMAGVFVYQMRSQPAFDAAVVFESQLDKADLEGFYADCVRPALAGKAVPQACQSAQAIMQAYSFEPQALLTIRVGQMADTARRIAAGDLITEAQYQECLALGECVAVPLIPPEIKNSTRPEDQAQAQEIAILFAHLVNTGTLTREVCDFMDVCRALKMMGIVTAEDFASVSEDG